MEVVRVEDDYGYIWFTESQIPPSLRKHPLKKSYRHAKCLADGESAERTIRFNCLVKENLKEASTAQIRVNQI